MINSKKKIIITFMGVDGVGKTTLAKKINKVFQNSQYLHLKPYILFPDRRTVIENPHLKKKKSNLFSFFQIISWLISYKIFFYNNKKKIYFFDRYAHDLLIDPIRYRYGLSRKLTKIILNYFPKPSLWIYLSTSLKIIKFRKIELSDYELKHQMKEYTKFFRSKKNILVLNTKKPTKILINQISKKIKNFVK